MIKQYGIDPKKRKELKSLELNARRYPENFFFVGPSSISEHAGLGVYARRDLPKGFRLPYPYPGKKVDNDKYDKLNAFLVSLTQKYDGNKNKPMDDPVVQKDLDILRENYNIDIKECYHTNVTSVECRKNSKQLIAWDTLYDNFIAYAYGIDDKKGHYYTLYWSIYSHLGKLAFDPLEAKYMTLLINEPPVYPYISLFNFREQFNSPSLIPVEDTNKVELYYHAFRDIKEGEELFLCYGPFYSPIRERLDYKINLDKTTGCGNYNIIKDEYLDQDINEVTYTNEKDITRFLIPAYKTNESSSKRVKKYFQNIQDYTGDNDTKLVSLDPETLQWFDDNHGEGYTGDYNDMRDHYDFIGHEFDPPADAQFRDYHSDYHSEENEWPDNEQSGDDPSEKNKSKKRIYNDIIVEIEKDPNNNFKKKTNLHF
jgi:hypothetical protein